MGLPKKIKSLIPLYTYRIEWDNEDEIFVVGIEELSGCMTHGNTHAEALEMGYEAVELHLESMSENGEEIPQPLSMQKFKGEFLVRTTPEIHRKLAMEAKAAGVKTLNKYVVKKLEA